MFGTNTASADSVKFSDNGSQRPRSALAGKEQSVGNRQFRSRRLWRDLMS